MDCTATTMATGKTLVRVMVTMGRRIQRESSGESDRRLRLAIYEMSCILMSDISEQVAALIKELLSLNRSENTPMAHPPSADDFEQRQSKRKRVRQELVLALSLRGL